MTFEGFDAAPLIEAAGFTPAVPGFAEPGTPDAATLDAALRVAARAERAEARAEATMLDLWIDRSGGANLRALESGTSRHAWVLPAQGDSILDLSGAGAKDVPLFAAFGDDKSEEEDGAVVKGTRPKTVDDDSDWADFWGGGGGDGSYGDPPAGGGETLSGSDAVAKDTPCVEEAPGGVALQELNNQALRQSNEIASRNDEMWEYGVIFYMKDGVLQNTGVFGGNEPGDINWNLGFPLVPNGAVIVAILHNHPDDPNVNDAIPSMNTMQNPGGQDWLSYDSFLSVADRNSRGITTDPNLLMYIYTNEDHKTRVYDKTDRNTTQKSCSLQA